jgi:PAS domain S-box-containing protein
MTDPNDVALLSSIHLSAIATVVTDAREPDNPICAANRAFERLTGYPVEEIVGRNCRFLSGEASEPEAAAMLRDAVAAGRPATAEILNHRRDGTPFRNAVMIAPVLGLDGRARFFVGSQMEVRGSAADRAADARRRVEGLTERQIQVLTLMAAGSLNKQIAHALRISEKTVKMHRAALLVRLGARASTDAVRLAVEAGL